MKYQLKIGYCFWQERPNGLAVGLQWNIRFEVSIIIFWFLNSNQFIEITKYKKYERKTSEYKRDCIMARYTHIHGKSKRLENGLVIHR